MSAPSAATYQAQPFLSNANYQRIVGYMRQQYAGRTGTAAIPERVDSRIQKTVQHYMTEIAKVHGANRPAMALNQEVVREVSASMDQWVTRQEAPQPVVRPPPLVAAPAPAPALAPAMPTFQQIPGPRPGVRQQPQQTTGKQTFAYVPSTFEEVSALYDRQQPKPMTASSFLQNPDSFAKIEEDDEDEDPIVLMKRAQKLRDEENAKPSAPRMEIQEIGQTAVSADPTPQAQPAPVRTVPLPQDYIIPQEPIVKYREKEYNIFLTSSDRDWFKNRTENRYSFSVTFNPGNRVGYGLSPSVQERFRNIQRIEFVKALLPTESLASLVRRQSNYNSGSPAFTTNTDRVLNVLGLPFVGVRIAELNNNGFSTNPREDNTFAIVQYDATWNSAASVTNAYTGGTPSTTAVGPRTNVGYTAFIPKFLKCQRVYEPTPLGGLQKMTIRMERHDGVVLSGDPDVFAIQRICLSDGFTNVIAAANTNFSYGGTSDNEYILIRTDTFFPYSAVSEGDLIAIQGYAAQQVATAPALATLDDFNRFINGTHYVVGVAYTSDNSTAPANIYDGANALGYCNVIVIRSRFNDPTTGSTGRSAAYFGGSSTEEDLLATALNSTDQLSVAGTSALLNTSRQTHLVLRVITRDMDSGSNIRPDNV